MKCFLVLCLAVVVYGQKDALALLKGKSVLSEIELDTAETGYAPVAQYDDHGSHGYGSYGKKVDDYGSYGHLNKGYKNYYGDNGYGNHGLNKYSDYHDSDHYGSKSGSHGNQYGSGLWSRNRGYGYEKHYAYDKELATSKHAANHGAHDSHYGAHDHSGHKGLSSYDKYGHNKYGGNSGHENNDYGKYGHLLNSYGNHGYGNSAHTQAVPIYHPPATTTVYHTTAPVYHAVPAPAYPTHGNPYGSGHGVTYY
jgi:hypothetical protein